MKEWNDEIIFVRQVTPGASERSFGIQVARLAGLPDGVVARAKQILASLEETDAANSPTTGNEKPAQIVEASETSVLEQAVKKTKRVFPRVDPSQLELF